MPNVLVIDDADEVRQVILDTLTEFGFAAREAKDGETGIKMALERPPDLIICDVRMPGMDGYQTLSAVRDHEEIANIPFIFLTAAMEKRDVRRGMSSGADDYLTKPFTPGELMDAVTGRLARQSELKCEAYKRAERLRESITEMFTKEINSLHRGVPKLSTS